MSWHSKSRYHKYFLFRTSSSDVAIQPLVVNNETAAILGLCALAQKEQSDKACDLENEVDLETQNSIMMNLGEDEDSSSYSDASFSTISSWDSGEDTDLSDQELEIEQISEIKSENRISSVLED